MASHKWSKEQRAKMPKMQKARFSKKKKEVNRPDVIQAAPNRLGHVNTPQEPKIDNIRIEERAFRHGIFTALQVVIDLLLKELR